MLGPESYATPAGTGYGMTISAFDLDQTLADLHSDEGADPVMLVEVMPPWWADALISAFARAN
jgi:hypothetical protein